MILIVCPPGWITVYPAQPLGMATLASFLKEQGIPFSQLDLEILAHEVNRDAPDRSLPLDEMLSLRRFSELLQRPEDRASLHKHYASCVDSLLAGVDCSKVGSVAFSIIGERQFASASILAGHFRARGIPVMAGGCFVRQYVGRIAPLGIFDLLFAGFDGPAFADACRFIERYHRHIDSIRINPFFLQKDSDISRHPERYGICIRPSSNAVLGFDEIGGPDWEHKKQATLRAIDRMYGVMRDHGIGFWGISSHLLLCALHENGSKDKAKSWLSRTHPYMCDDIPPERIQWRMYHAHEPDQCPYGESWEANCGLIYESGLHWPAVPA
jgi:hypothetical protein